MLLAGTLQVGFAGLKRRLSRVEFLLLAFHSAGAYEILSSQVTVAFGIELCELAPGQGILALRFGGGDGIDLLRITATPAAALSVLPTMTGVENVEVTAGGQTRDLTTADGDLVPNGPRMTPVDEATRLTGMPGGPYEACFMDDGEEG